MAQGEVSKLISNMWKNESEIVRAEYERRAECKKQEHQAMYPGYRFQPMKKEEKERLKEEKRLEKERDRAQSSRRGRTRPAPYTVGMVAPQMPQTMSYYHPEVHYGPAGPSPPLSAASSPNSTSPCPDSSGLDDHSALQSAHASPGPDAYTNNTTPSSTFQNTIPLPQLTGQFQFVAPQQGSSHLPVPGPSQWNLPPPPQEQQQQQQQHSSDMSWSDFNSSKLSLDPPAEDFVSFDLPQQSWVSDTAFVDTLSALINTTDHPSIFELDNFDPNALLEHPSGEIDVSLGEFNFDATQFNFGDFDFSAPALQSTTDSGSIAPTDTNFNDFASLFSSPNPVVDTTSVPAVPPQQQHREFSFNSDNMLDYLNFDTTLDPAVAQPPPQQQQHAAPLLDHSFGATPAPVPAPSSHYVPPAGAAYSSTRRVAASWKPRFAAPDSPIDHSPPHPWGVPAG
jgi:hypothetical protein